MASEMDSGIGQIVANLTAAKELNRTLICFTSDNGGPTNGFEGTQSNNYPLRGGKKTMWEGGTRVVGLGIEIALSATFLYDTQCIIRRVCHVSQEGCVCIQ
jgi:hypothetical protein